MKNKFALLLCILHLLSCSSSESEKLRKESASFLGKDITVPYSKMIVFSSDISDSLYNKDKDTSSYVYVSYLDSTECTPCHLSKVNEWEEIVSIFNKSNLSVDVVLIYVAKEDAVSTLWKSYNSNGCLRKVYVDTSNVFKNTNKFLPIDKKLHTFLLNPQGKVVLIGDPIRNEKIRELIKKYIDAYIL